jgi:hypothetical protein
MSQHLFKFCFAIWSILLGVLLPYVSIFGLGHYVNLPWSFLYGLGLVGSFQLFNGDRRPIIGLGGFLWPLLLCAIIFWLSGRLWASLTSVGRRIALSVLFLSSFFAVGFIRAIQPPFDAIPTYAKLMYIAW